MYLVIVFYGTQPGCVYAKTETPEDAGKLLKAAQRDGYGGRGESSAYVKFTENADCVLGGRYVEEGFRKAAYKKRRR
jgi:hypothetical protein